MTYYPNPLFNVYMARPPYLHLLSYLFNKQVSLHISVMFDSLCGYAVVIFFQTIVIA